ncbi:TPA: hypothetical protein DCG86_02095, partial [Candidatus Marinimicrobia bacterium]|nr:hypothetical protein [Candidatus Neomarinimicrobiota bacterium]
QLKEIVDIQFKRVQKRLSIQNIHVELDESARDYLAEKGYDPDFGARPLKRLIQREVENRLAQHLLEGKIIPGKKYVLKMEHGDLHVEAQ